LPNEIMVRQTICEVCGCIAQSTDNDQRKENHLSGKQHKGFVAIREGIQTLKDIIAASRKEDPDFDRGAGARANGRENSKDRDIRREAERLAREKPRGDERADAIPQRDRYHPEFFIDNLLVRIHFYHRDD